MTSMMICTPFETGAFLAIGRTAFFSQDMLRPTIPTPLSMTDRGFPLHPSWFLVFPSWFPSIPSWFPLIPSFSSRFHCVYFRLLFNKNSGISFTQFCCSAGLDTLIQSECRFSQEPFPHGIFLDTANNAISYEGVTKVTKITLFCK